VLHLSLSLVVTDLCQQAGSTPLHVASAENCTAVVAMLAEASKFSHLQPQDPRKRDLSTPKVSVL